MAGREKEVENLIVENMKLIGVALKCFPYIPKIHQDEIQGAAIEGLVKAAKDYTEREDLKQYKFSTVAVWHIRSNIDHQVFRKMKAQRRIPENKVLYLKAPIGNDGERLVEDVIPDGSCGVEDAYIAKESLSEFVRFLDTIQPAHKEIVLLRLEDKTQQEIASITGKSQVHVSRVIMQTVNAYLGISPDKKVKEAMKLKDSAVVESVSLEQFEVIPVDVQTDNPGYDVLLIAPNSKFTAYVRLPLMISNTLMDGDNAELRISVDGKTITVRKDRKGFELKKRGALRVIYSRMVKDKLNAKNIQLPAQYRVTPDERIDGWVCRKIE